MYDGILSTVGNTPLVLLSRLLPSAPFRLYAKLESFQPGRAPGLRELFGLHPPLETLEREGVLWDPEIEFVMA